MHSPHPGSLASHSSHPHPALPPIPLPGESPPAVVTCENLTFRYAGQPVLEGVSFSIREGESLCVIGPNGGGKSTLLKLMLGLLEPEAGRLEIFGLPPVKARTRMGYVPQAARFDPLFPITAFDIVLMGRLDHLAVGRFSRSCRKRALEALEEVGMAGQARQPFANLSGGQRQRVLIARALATEPDLLLLDEPTANIDLSVEAQFLETIAHLRERIAILLVTHDLDLAPVLGSSILCVHHWVHRHTLPLSGDLIREIYSSSQRLTHDRRACTRQDTRSR